MATMRTRNGLYVEMGRYYEAASGTTFAELQAAMSNLTMEEYLDSFILTKDDWLDGAYLYIKKPVRADAKVYCASIFAYTSNRMWYIFQITPTDYIESYIDNTGAVGQQKKVSDSSLTLSGWKLYLRK